jgi:hypothetical protein
MIWNSVFYLAAKGVKTLNKTVKGVLSNAAYKIPMVSLHFIKLAASLKTLLSKCKTYLIVPLTHISKVH